MATGGGVKEGIVLETKDLSKHFGGLKAVDEVNLQIDSKEGIHGIIGPNGAGKTTLFNLITGHLKPTKGLIYFKGRRIDGLEPHRIVRLGIARTFQIVRPFTGQSVLENVLVAWGHRYYDTGRVFFSKYSSAREEGLKILEFVGLKERRDLPAGALPIGLLRRLEIARAIALNPSLLLLDEPAAGLTEEEIAHLKELIRKIVAQGVTVILVEHKMSFVMDICAKITVLDWGRVIAEGQPGEIANNPHVIEAYLGTPMERRVR